MLQSDRQAGTEIEVTPEMIEAGGGGLSSFFFEGFVGGSIPWSVSSRAVVQGKAGAGMTKGTR